MDNYVSAGRWCYVPLLAVSNPLRSGFEFMQSDEFVECAVYWYAKLLDGVTVCEGILEEEGNNSEDWVDPDEEWHSPAYYRQYQENEKGLEPSSGL